MPRHDRLTSRKEPLVLRAEVDGMPVRIAVSDIDGFVYAAPRDLVVVYYGPDGAEAAIDVRKEALKNITVYEPE